MSTGHPRGLVPLFFTEMWERFGFYSMLSVLSLYMNAAQGEGGLGFNNDQATQVYGLYIACVYLTPLLGGYLADRWLGYGWSIVVGGVILAGGYALLSAPSVHIFYLGLATLALGNGLFKPNISTLLGNLYHDRKEMKDTGYSIFYMGINVGALIAPLVATWIKQTYGWRYTFLAASVGMVLSLIIFMATRRLTIEGEALAGIHKDSKDATAGLKLTAKEKHGVKALFILYGVVIFFWMAFHQNGSTLNFWARDNTLPLFGLDFKERAEVTQSINPFFVIVFSLFVVVPLWRVLRKRNLEPSTAKKIFLGMGLTALSFAWMGVAGLSGGDTGRVSAWWLVSGYGIVTLGELCLSPMGLSLVSKLAPARHGGLFMGLWFLATAAGNYLSGAVGSLWDDWPHSHFFFLLSGSSIAACLLLAFFVRLIDSAVAEAS